MGGSPVRNFVALALLGALALPLTALPQAARAGDTQERRAAEPGPTDAGDDASDLQITQSIRQALVRAEDLSAAARKATITTEDGVVTLRGHVETADEKQRLGAIAQGTPGVVRIRNELLVKGR
jgi:hyperosmotically inducible protein